MAMLIPSTTALSADGFTEEISPSLPLSLPASTTTLSPFFSLAAISEHLRRERDDLHEVLRAQLTNHGPEDPGADGLVVVVEDHGGVAVKTDGGAILAAHFLGGAHDDGLADVALLDAATRNGLFHRHHNDVADGGVFPLGATQDLDALNSPGSGIVSNIQIGLHLDHLVSPDVPDRRFSTLVRGFRSNRGMDEHVRRARPPPSAWFSTSARIPEYGRSRRPCIRCSRHARGTSWTSGSSWREPGA